jgi:hypothetical protein
VKKVEEDGEEGSECAGTGAAKWKYILFQLTPDPPGHPLGMIMVHKCQPLF